ncbi:hypothetical protein ASF41_18920 [Methylobacterium sp. Leaf111]|nr:hypothetical protein ASF41_18920 [Methylobacterium sp. Leaf111]
MAKGSARVTPTGSAAGCAAHVWWLPVSGAWIGQSYGTFGTGGASEKLCGGGGEAASHSSPLASQGLNGRDLRLA